MGLAFFILAIHGADPFAAGRGDQWGGGRPS